MIEIAAGLFRKKGYHATSIQDIAEQAGILKGSLYHYIASKDDLLFEVIMAAGRPLLEGLRSVVQQEVPADQKLTMAIAAHMKLFEEKNDETCVFLNELSNLPPTLKEQTMELISEYENFWTHIIEEGKQEGLFKNLDPRLTSFAILGLCNWTHNWFRPQGRASGAELAALFTEIVLQGILDNPTGKERG